ncbi:polysaccharide biosynthesis/export family protein [Aeoliella mucimassa]|nr:polysaccharide biosynthesis/export family protein [Aeoliella mucimassa]
MSLSRLSSMASGSSLLAAGDLLNITVLSGLEDEPKAKPARIGDDGTINVPLVGAVRVAGLDEQQAAELVRVAAIERGIFRNPQVTIRVTERAMNYVTVLGAVSEPGTHPVPKSSSNLLVAIAAAGGFTEEAGTEVEVLRQPRRLLADKEKSGNPSMIQTVAFEGPMAQVPESRTQRIDLAMLSDSSAGEEKNLSIGDQDVVMVHPSKKRVVHVSGLVREPDQFEMPRDQDLHVLDAIAMAGGASSPVADKVFVIRRLEEEAEPLVIQVSISKAKMDGNENLRLAPGDMVSVETTISTSIVDSIKHVFRISAGVGGNFLSF